MIPYEVWQKEKDKHQKILGEFLDPQVKRREKGIRHPIYDFLFEYYSFRVGHLLDWSPGVGVHLEFPQTMNVPDKYTKDSDNLYWIQPSSFPDKRKDFLLFALNFLEKVKNNTPRFNCYGLHEWAMVYKDSNLRHSNPLRLTEEETNSVVEKNSVCCSHIDAYRFFTPAARDLNKFEPTRAEQINNDQPACIHVNMDLYKFAFKLYPYINSNIIREAFLLALYARVIDMRASPYDFSSYGFLPIKIESQEGKLEYIEYQKEIADRGKMVRELLINELTRIKELAF